MNTVTLEQLAEQRLQRVEVYLDRFKRCVTLEELTGPRVLKATQWATEAVMGTEDVRRIDPAKRQALRIVLAMVDESLGKTDEERARHVDVILNLAYIDQLLLVSVLDLLAEGTLTEEQREVLRQEKPPAELLEAVMGARSPESLIEDTPSEELDMLLDVALAGFPAALTGQFSLSTIRLLHEALLRGERRRAALVAQALVPEVR